MNMIPQMPSYQGNRVGKRRIGFGIPSCVTHAASTFFEQEDGQPNAMIENQTQQSWGGAERWPGQFTDAVFLSPNSPPDIFFF